MNKLKRKELWKLVKTFPDYKTYFPIYRDIRNEDLVNFLEAQNEVVYGGLDIQKFITTIAPNTEFHLIDQSDDGKIKKASFCGPGSKLSKRLKNFNPETGENEGFITPPINELDEGCYHHDIAYTKHKDLKGRHEADRELIKVADKVLKNPNARAIQKLNAGLVKALLNAKVLFGGCGCGCENCKLMQQHQQDLLDLYR